MANSADIRITQQGTTFYRSTDGSSYTAVTDLKMVTTPGRTRKRSEDTVITATRETNTPAYQEDTAVCKLTFFMTETQYAAYVTDYNSKTGLYWKSQYIASGTETTGPAITFQGYVTGLPDPGKAEAKSTDKLYFDVEIEVTTTPAYVAGS